MHSRASHSPRRLAWSLGLMAPTTLIVLALTAGQANAISLPLPPVASSVAAVASTTALAALPAGVPAPGSLGYGCDDCTASVSLPRPFTFFGITTSQVVVSSNGLVTLQGRGTSQYSNAPLPYDNQSLRYTLMPFWTDLITSVQTSAAGTTQDPQFVIQWTGSYYYSSVPVNFQTVLHLAQGTVEYRYGNVPFAGRAVTVGAMGGQASDAFQVLYGTPSSGTGYTLGRLSALAPPAPPAPPAQGSSDTSGYSGRTTYRGYNPGFTPYGRPAAPVAPAAPPIVTLPNTAGRSVPADYDGDT